MTQAIDVAFWAAAAAVLLTKAADVWTTWRLISERGESNPLARWLFARLGVPGGLAVVGALAALVVMAVWLSIDAGGGSAAKAAVAAYGFAIAAIQAEVARCNWTGRHSRLTRSLAVCFARLGRHAGGAGRGRE